MFLPYKADVDVKKLPISNILIIVLTVLIFLYTYYGNGPVDGFVLTGLDLGLISHVFMHGGVGHLFGNMFFLWVFGNAVCSRVGNPTYPSLYLFLAVVAGIVHLAFDGDPAVGASGAVNGIMGIYLFLYPLSYIRCVWTPVWAWRKTFSIKAFWLIGAWFMVDLWGAFYGKAQIAYTGHLGGLLGGLATGWLMLKYGWVQLDVREATLDQVFSGGNYR